MRLFFAAVLLLAACSPPAATSTVEIPTLMVLATTTEIPLQTATPVPTTAPEFTFTPSLIPPTETETPTATLTPTATSQCAALISAWWDDSESIIIEFFDTASVADSTSRGSLSPIILEMRRIQRRFEAPANDECSLQVYVYFANGMNFIVEGFTAFLGELETSQDAYFQIASDYLYLAMSSLEAADIRVSGFIRDNLRWGIEPSRVTATAAEVNYRTMEAEARAAALEAGDDIAPAVYGTAAAIASEDAGDRIDEALDAQGTALYATLTAIFAP